MDAGKDTKIVDQQPIIDDATGGQQNQNSQPKRAIRQKDRPRQDVGEEDDDDCI